MDAKRYRLRPFEDGDYEALGRLQTERYPELPTTAHEEREWDETLARARVVNEKWVVEDHATREIVAVAALYHALYSFDPHKFWVLVLVGHRHTRQGIGRALASLLYAEAVDHRALCFWTNVRKDDERSHRFAAQQGFRTLRTTWMSVLDLSGPASPSPGNERSEQLTREGIRFTTLAEEGPRRPEVRHRLYELWTEASRDVPRMGEYVPVSFEQFEAEIDRVAIVPEAFFLAGHGDSYVASSHLERDLAESDALMVGFTATRAAFRGRGLATELKQQSIDYARSHGIRRLKTFNDSANDGILRINEKLGFRRAFEISNLQRDFAPGPVTGQPGGGS